MYNRSIEYQPPVIADLFQKFSLTLKIFNFAFDPSSNMPICTVQLLALRSALPDFLSALSSTSPQPLIISKVLRWIVRPTTLSLDLLLNQSWDLLIIYASPTGLPTSLKDKHVYNVYTVQAGVPSSLVSAFAGTNERLLHPQENGIRVPELTGALNKPRIVGSAQNLELTDELLSWSRRWDPDNAKGAVSMLNLLKFKPGGGHDGYMNYARAFAESIGKRRGGEAKVVGKVTGEMVGADVWEEVALAHYPSISHFVDMAGSEDYQELNLKHRVPSLEDTCILMTSEMELLGGLGGGGGGVVGTARL